ncbi:isopeptide-forming domain-containing fimbrial protein [Microbacterium sp. TNHR37B]|uniref:isopeptide-forming domain-containing fimbrial protein n=1 Tax=Microbacterium sp. TNHR37B TaxID=1775956 RepID=UPI0007B22606|nr:isopeptide-forming domain-containing fimbrial protein [Microbacterium sp. TNHR37B]KZE89425.1 hypothetical protein AVP41_02219 [Microbacterium sp. TNHR37B]
MKRHLRFADRSAQIEGVWRERVRRMIGGAAGAAVVASSLVVAGAASPAAAAEPFECAPDAVYVQSTSEVREFTVTADGGALSSTGIGANHTTNGLGISAGGRYAYTVTNAAGNKVLAKHDRVTDTTATTSFTLNSSVLRGAVHPTTGVYYFASNTTNNAIALYAWNENVSPQTYVQVGTLRPTAGSSAFGSNGDMAFSASGQLVLVADRYIYSADIPLELTSSTATIGAKQVHDMGAGVEGNGIAFGNLGHIFVSAANDGNRIIEVDLARGETVNTTSLGTFSPTDMASCTFPNTLTLKKNVPSGRHAATDQFGLRIDSPSDYQVPQTNASTTGTTTGVQPDYAGPVFTNQGDPFTLSESAVGTTDLSRYASSLVCEQLNSDGSTSPVSVGSSGQITQPQGSLGTEVVCTFTNARLAPSLDLRKTSDPADGAAVTAGQTITYTVEAENTGNTTLDPVQVTDDLSGVLAHAEYQGDVTTSIDDAPVSAGGATVTGDTLAWTGVLEPGQVVTITYSVIVNDDVEGETIANSVTASGTPPGGLDPVEPPVVTVEHPVAGFEIAKSADPASGSVVEPGQVIEYTVTGTNTGATTLNPATIADDLSAVLAHAEYNGDVATRIGGTPVTSGGATVSGDDLAWTGTLQPGEVVTITYSVTVDDDASGEILANVATGSGTPTTPDPANPGGPQIPGTPIQPPSVDTQHPVIGSGFTVGKTANPASGTAVSAGDTIQYTIVGTNTGDTDLDPAEIVDDLAGVLDDATYNGDVSATLGTATVAGNTLTWTGAIPRGQAVTITYSVTVNDGVERALLRNTVTGEATPQIPEDPSDPDSPTTPGTPITPPPAETEHPVVVTGFEVVKSADPASGTAVGPGDTITYTVTGTNTGNTELDPASITDDLSAVLTGATLGEVSATVGDVDVDGSALTWTGTLAPGAQVVITYTVTVNDDATGVLLRNTVTGEATPQIPEDPTDPESPTDPGDPITPPPGSTEHPVVNPGFEVDKTANPQTGTAVDPGEVIEYTVRGTNSGDVTLDPARIVDDLSSVLTSARYNGDVQASTGDVTVEDGALRWAGTLAAGQDVVITYSVTVDADAGGETVRNTVTGEVTPLLPSDPSDPESPSTPGTSIVPPPVSTEHPINEPGFTFTKSVDPASGTAVDPGAVLTYTLTGVNTGETVLDPVDIVDDLSAVLSHATYNGDATASVGDAGAPDPVVSGDRLTWSGALEVGQAVVITYSVTVGADAAGEVLENTATATATPPGGGELTPPPGTTRNPVNEPGFSVSKSADPASGTAVDPGDLVTYTVTGTNTGETALDPVSITDDLRGVLAHAALTGTPSVTIDGAPAAAPVVAGETLSWTGALPVGSVVTLTYTVEVAADAGGATLENSVTGSATPPGGVPPIETPPAVTEHPVNAPGFEVTKTSDPAAGRRVDPGSVVTYTVTGINTGATALDPVTLVDDLSKVLGHADFNDDAVAAIDGEPAGDVVATDAQLKWAGALAVGQRVTLTYSVTVHGDAGGALLQNTATGVAVPPGGTEVTPPPSVTEHPVGQPGYTFEKTSDPGSGTAVGEGSVVHYTLTGVNTGETRLDEVVISDDLSGVLDHATFNDDVAVTVGDREVAAPSLEGTTLTWSGALAEGETVTITYSVTVKTGVTGATLRNVATSTATPPGGETITPPPSATDNEVEILAVSGGQFPLWLPALALLLLIGGGALLLRRRSATE